MLARLIFGGDGRNREGGESGGINDSFCSPFNVGSLKANK
jgi:hypothetical protein